MTTKKSSLFASCVRPHVREKERFFCESGSRLARNFKMVVTEQKHLEKFAEDGIFVDGMKALDDSVPRVGEWLILEDKPTDLYEQIQSHREGCDLKILLKKYQNGDESALNAVQGVYGDFTDAPVDLADAYAMAKNYEAAFNGLPLEIRKEYGHNPARWMHAVTSGEFHKRFMPEATEKVSKDIKDTNAVAPTASADQAATEVKGEVTNE